MVKIREYDIINADSLIIRLNEIENMGQSINIKLALERVLSEYTNINNFYIDLEKVNYADSSFLGGLLSINTKCIKENKNFYIFNLTERVYDIYQTASLNKILDIKNPQ